MLMHIKRMRWAGNEKQDLTYSDITENENDFLEAKYQIIEGNYKNRIHFDSMRIWHKNEKAAIISRALFKKICIACDKEPKGIQFKSLFHIPFAIYIKHSASKDGSKMYVNVRSAKKIEPQHAQVEPEKTTYAVTYANHEDDSDLPF